MLIEIRDLPAGRKVKHINVDITFEEDGISVTTKPNVPEVNISTPNPVKIESSEQPIVNIENRAQKEVPQEMLDMEF